MPIERNSNSDFSIKSVAGDGYTLGERILEKVFFPLSFSWFGGQNKDKEKRPLTSSSGSSKDLDYFRKIKKEVDKNEQEGMSQKRAIDKAIQKLGR